jgi:GNAT superfamily N-acetyltransferase
MNSIAHSVAVERDSAEAREAIRHGLNAFNEAKLGPYAFTPVTVCARDEAGALLGGAVGGTFLDWLWLEVLWVSEPERGRGLGTRVLETFEEEGRRLGATRCLLDTMAYQAEGFYLGRGYKEFGRIPNFVQGFDRIYLEKDLR